MTRAIDTNRDWAFGRGLQDYRTGADELAQAVGTRIRSWQGNAFFDPAQGVDWNNLLDIGTKPLLDLDIQRVMYQTAGVVRIRSYKSTLDRETRELTVEANLDTIYGEMALTEVL